MPAPVVGPAVMPPPAQGALPPGNANQAGGVPNINNQINEPGAGNPPGMGGAPPAPGPIPAPAPDEAAPPPGNEPDGDSMPR